MLEKELTRDPVGIHYSMWCILYTDLSRTRRAETAARDTHIFHFPCINVLRAYTIYLSLFFTRKKSPWLSVCLDYRIVETHPKKKYIHIYIYSIYISIKYRVGACDVLRR